MQSRNNFQELEQGQQETNNTGKFVYKVITKFIDTADDIWNFLRSFISGSKFIGPFLVGGLGFLLHAMSGYEAGGTAYKAYLDFDNKEGQRYTRMVTNSLRVLFSGTGMGLSMAFIVGTLGQMGVLGGLATSVAGMAFFPVLIPAFITAGFVLNVWEKAYIFTQAKKAEVRAGELCLAGGFQHLPDPEARDNRIETERELAFSALEMAASGIVTLGVILGTVAFFGAASVASFGTLPLALLITGVAIGFFSQVFKWQDEKHQFAFTKGIRNFFTPDPVEIVEETALTQKPKPAHHFHPPRTFNIQNIQEEPQVVTTPKKREIPPMGPCNHRQRPCRANMALGTNRHSYWNKDRRETPGNPASSYPIGAPLTVRLG